MIGRRDVTYDRDDHGIIIVGGKPENFASESRSAAPTLSLPLPVSHVTVTAQVSESLVTRVTGTAAAGGVRVPPPPGL